MKKIRLFPFFILIAFFSNSQENNKNSLEFLIQKAGSFAWSNKDSAYYYYNKIKTLATAEKKWSTLAENYINTIRSAGYYSRKELDLQTINTNLNALKTLFKEQKHYFKSDSNFDFYKNCLLNDRATYYFQLDDYELAQNTFDELIDNILTNTVDTLSPYDAELLLSAYIYKAKMYSDEGKYELSKVYFDRNLRLLEELKPEDKKSLMANYSLMGELFKRQENYQKANSYFIPSLIYKLENKGKKNGIITDAQNIFSNYIKLKDVDSAKFYLNIIKNNIEENDDTNQTHYLYANAELFKALGDFESAVNEQKKRLALIKSFWGTKKNLEVSQAYSTIALSFLENNNYEQALATYNQAIAELTDITSVNSSVNKTELLKIYNKKISLLLKLKHDNQALITSKKAIQLLDSLKPTFKTETDKLFIIDQAYPIFENGITAIHNLYSKTKNDSLIDDIFYITEKSKSTLLIEALLSAKATHFKTIPDSLLTIEKQLKSEINFIEKKINKSKTDINLLKDNLFVLKKEYNNIIKTIENNYKSYYDLKYNSDVVSIETLQHFLNKDAIVISYFYGKESLTITSITKTDSYFTQIKIDDAFENLLKEIYILLSNPKSDLQLLNYKTFELYTKILKPHLNYTNKKNLVILPDGLLNYIPFSALATEESDYGYLIEDYAISYVNSATLLLQLQQKKQNNKNVLAFAPNFDNNHLLALPNNKKEVKNVLSHFSGLAFSDTEATLENFNNNNSNYSILHLATHAIFDDATPEYSYLAFASNVNNDNSLYVRDLYNLELSADMVTLSACESGIGKLNRGEGLMSLARGFYFSGANSITSTLWKINDASSTKLMDGFYKLLSDGKTKDYSLQKAQLDFVKTNRENGFSHPYYWSGFVISGNTSPINTNYYYLVFIGGLAVVLLLIYYFVKKRKR